MPGFVRSAAALLLLSAPGHVLFHIADPRIIEASGIAVGIASPGVVYVQNDSGDTARFFAVDARTGETRATYSVPGAANVDWEDMAVAPDSRGVPSIWIADIGDNDNNRSEVRLYRVDEPHVDMARSGVEAQTAPAQIWRLRYPGGPVDAEGLAVAPGGAAYVFTKSIFGATRVYSVPPAPDPARVRSLRPIGGIDFHPTGTPGGPNIVGQLTATGAALSRDGSRLVVRTYTDAYVWRVTGGDVGRALRTAPIRVALPAQKQGEGVTFDGGRLLVDSEGAGSDVLSLPAPQPAATTPPVATTADSAPSAGSSPTASSGSTSPNDPFDASAVAALVAAGAVLVFGAGWMLRRRR